VADALDECAIEIASLKSTAAEKSHRLGNGMWQVGDRTEQNGTFKIESKKAKADKVRNKIGAVLPVTLEKTNIVQIVNLAWQKMFATVDMNERSAYRLQRRGGVPSITSFLVILNSKKQRRECSQLMRYMQNR
jgi:hypothetical protein